MNERLLINGRFLARQPTGVDRFATEAIRSMLTHLPPDMEMDLAVPPGAPDFSSRLSGNLPIQAKGYFQGNTWEQLSLPLMASSRFVLNLCNTAPLALRNQMVVIHDAATLATPGNYGASFRRWYRFLHGTLLRRSRLIATVSRFSASELSRYFGVDSKAFTVIPESGDHILRVSPDQGILGRQNLLDSRFVLAVGSRTTNKNFGLIADAMKLIAHRGVKLVAVGSFDASVYSSAPGSNGDVLSTGYLSDAELRSLYEAASCFVFPSFYEGFGLPPLEAMTCGCPVVVSNRASLPEVCADAALYCDPTSPQSLATQIDSLLSSESLRIEMKGRGLERARQYRWDETGKVILDAIRRL